MDFKLQGLNALITGGSKGIGRSIASLLAQEGANVGICARNSNDLDSTIKHLSNYGVKAIGKCIDVSNSDELKGWITSSDTELGGIDILVLNVSALAIPDTEESWVAEFEVDMMHTVRSVEAALPSLERSSSGSIVIISSVSGVEIDFAAGPYGAFKAALIHYAKALSTQLASKGIRCNSVSPGNTYFDGGVWQNIEKENPDLFNHALSLNKTGRMATAEEVATAAVFLASPISSFTSGTNLTVDGALTNRVQY